MSPPVPSTSGWGCWALRCHLFPLWTPKSTSTGIWGDWATKPRAVRLGLGHSLALQSNHHESGQHRLHTHTARHGRLLAREGARVNGDRGSEAAPERLQGTAATSMQRLGPESSALARTRAHTHPALPMHRTCGCHNTHGSVPGTGPAIPKGPARKAGGCLQAAHS